MKPSDQDSHWGALGFFPESVAAVTLYNRKVFRDSVQKNTESAIRRLAHHCRVKRISGLIFEETRGVLKVFQETSVPDGVTQHAKRKKVIAMEVVYALTRQGRTLYGFRGLTRFTNKRLI
ncbi:histone H4-like [Etheostoma spectabile]|uniref:histone H4-like n=1 Tax=Etheostoma spectabile TaxID=54343 RepID=UPI0013AF5120|nr:histone H4-like [Etheostoma spectabile]